MALERLFAWLDRVLGADEPAAQSAVVTGPAPAARREHPSLALLSIDGAGQWLLCGADRLTLGHLRAAEADLLFLADVGARHATLLRSDSLQVGPGWRIEPVGAERVEVAGVLAAAGGRRIGEHEVVRLGGNLELRLHCPDPASASVELELLHGQECAGARHVLLLASGPGGRVRIGAAGARHVRVAGLESEIELRWNGAELELASELAFEGARSGKRIHVPFPPRERLSLTCGGPRGARPPFGLSLEPVLRP
ncbi:MAG TPA: hypothetical protein VF530_23830 [Planctomycetota bacterium]